jgi:hypothetical protein
MSLYVKLGELPVKYIPLPSIPAILSQITVLTIEGGSIEKRRPPPYSPAILPVIVLFSITLPVKELPPIPPPP